MVMGRILQSLLGIHLPTVGACLFILQSLVFWGQSATVTIFDNIPEPGQTNYNTSYTSIGFQATQTTELGNLINFAGTARNLNTIKVNMVTYAKSNDANWDPWRTNNPSLWNTNGYFHDLTMRVYQMTSSNTIQLLTSQTKTNVLVPWAQPSGINSITLTPNDGQAFSISYDFSAENLILPDSVIISIGFDTQGNGDFPTGVVGPYNSLNFGVLSTNAITVGSDANSQDFFWVTGNNPTPFFASASDYPGYAPMMEVTATEASTVPYDVWIASYGYTVGAAPARRSDDPDQDGLNNLTEFAFGLDPTANSPNPITIIRTNTVTNTVTNTIVRLRWLQRNDGSATYTNRSTTNLTSGFPSGNSPQFSPVQSEDQTSLPRSQYTRIEFTTNTSAFLRHFYKVDAQEAP